LWLATERKNGGGVMTVKWKPIFSCPHGCNKFFGSSVALNWHLEEHKEETT
tara:strand:+ start:166 stop:318 length:153 start_codon:yes stop_codon:yes gene_type:complete